MYRALVFLHVVAACLWVGGLLFFALVLVPALRRSRDPRTVELVRAVGKQFRVVGWIDLGVLVATGIGNLLYRVPLSTLTEGAFWGSDFGRLLAMKLGLVLAMVGISIVHDVVGIRAMDAASSGTASAQSLRRFASQLGRATAMLALGVVLLATLLVRGW